MGIEQQMLATCFATPHSVFAEPVLLAADADHGPAEAGHYVLRP
jgi:hypothetical protein